MVPFKFGGLRVRHDSTFEVDIVSFLNYNSKNVENQIYFVLSNCLNYVIVIISISIPLFLMG